MTPEQILEHDWDQELIKKYGNARCKRCGIQYEYYKRNLQTLSGWSDEDREKEKEHYDKMVRQFKECKPRQ